MPSFRSSLNQVLPTCYNQLSSTSSSTTQSNARSIPETVQLWDVQEEINEFYEHLQVDSALEFEAMRPNQIDFHTESDVQVQVRQTLLRTAQHLMQRTHRRQIFITTPGEVDGTRQVVYEPDMIAWRRRERRQRRTEPSILLPIEIKKPHLQRGESSERDLRVLYQKERNPNGRAHRVIEQEVGYMDRNACEYGMITSYFNSYALKLDGRSNIVYVSRPFAYDETDPTVLKVLYFLLSRALSSHGLGGKDMRVRVENTSNRRKERCPSPPTDSNEPPPSPSTIRETCVLKSRKGNNVTRGEYRTSSVILKRAHISKSDKLVHETEMYRHMRDLQGRVIPQVLGSGHEGEYVYLILEDCGEPVESTLDDCPEVSEAIHLLHKMNVCHNDLRWRNIVCRDSDIRIIDFEDAAVVTDSHILKAEADAFWSR